MEHILALQVKSGQSLTLIQAVLGTQQVSWHTALNNQLRFALKLLELSYEPFQSVDVDRGCSYVGNMCF